MKGRIAQSENGPTSLTVALGGTIDLSQLNYFKKLAEVLHYTRAAQGVHHPADPLGAISSLEKELGRSLFERNGRSVLLTPYGEVFYEHVCLALRAIDDGVAAVSARSSASFGTVNLGTTFTTQDHYLPSLIRDFEEAFDKRVIVKVSQGFTNYLTEQLHLRARWMWPSAASATSKPDIAYFPVKHCELALYVRDDHPLASAG
ncbi:MAG: LysR family transcriptional regulator [Adlercreutzia equolifaciens]